mmetsp:Transcript_84141/g.131351  ORF Transcript_84141/g.131351 Transcript_84141/m.131351 type:complete len:612 (-) Transcript_84141:216-2051(-)
MRNARHRKDFRWVDDFKIEASVDDRTYKVVARGRLPQTSVLVQVDCIKKYSFRYIKFTSHSGGGLSYFAALRPAGQPPPRYLTPVPPPKHLWDLATPQHLEMVRCSATIIVSELMPKSGTFSLRMKCSWSFRTLKEAQGCEYQLRGVPGIRMPALSVNIEESRLWKDLSGDRSSDKSIYWEGTSTFTISGFKMFHMDQFPFDRHVIDLEQFIFVWCTNKDAAEPYKPMRMVDFSIDTVSTLAEWQCQPAYVIPIARYVTTPEGVDDPSYATQFFVKLRVEHQHIFYVWQVLFPALLMTLTSVTPLAMPPSQDDMGDRLAVYGGGLLTLVAFKYGVAEHLPSVPYATFVDHYLTGQIVCISFCALESVVSFHLILRGYDHDEDNVYWNLDKVENLIFYILLVVWFIYFFFLGYVMPLNKQDWRDVFNQSDNRRYFERSSVDSFRQSSDFPHKAKFVVIRDDLPIWNLEDGKVRGHLKAREVVRACGDLERFYLKDNQLHSEREFQNGSSGDYEVVYLMSIEGRGGKPRGSVEVFRLTPNGKIDDRFDKAMKKEASKLPYDRWDNVRLLETDVVTEERKCKPVASLRKRCCTCGCCCKCSSASSSSPSTVVTM